jgi:hypothetical protein
MGSRYPDAVPLKRVDVVTVAEAMMELFLGSRNTDRLRASVFTSKLMRESCQLMSRP